MRKQNGNEKAARAKRIVNTALESLAQALDRGESEGLKNHLRAMARFSRYSVANVTLIFTQQPEATRVEGFKTWQRLGRQVKKGEKGIMIRAPFTFRTENGRNESARDETLIGFRAAYVFDVSQTEGEHVPTLATPSGNPGKCIDALKVYTNANGIQVTTDENLPYLGACRGKAVVIREDLPPAEHFSTLVHELAHAILHQGETADKPIPRVQETEAEAVAFIVCEAFGLDSLQASTDYIHLYQGNAVTLWDSLERIQSASSELIGSISTSRSNQLAA